MGASRPLPWPSSDVTIRELYGLERAAPGMPGSDLTSVLFSHESFRALFASVSAGTYLGSNAAACYLGISQLGIERKLTEAFSTADTSWRTVLAISRTDQGGDAAPCQWRCPFSCCRALLPATSTRASPVGLC